MKSCLFKILGVSLVLACWNQAQAQVVVPVDAGGPVADNNITTFTFTVNQSFTVADLTLQFSASHENIPDLEAFLRSPSGTTVVLFSEVGFGTSPDPLGKRAGYFQDVLFTDSAAARIDNFAPAKLTGEFQVQFAPDNLGVFSGENALGTWELLVKDLAPEDTGYLYKNGDNSNLIPTPLARFGVAQGTELTLVPVPEPTVYGGVFGLAALGFGILRSFPNRDAAKRRF